MTPEQRDETLQSSDFLCQALIAVYKHAVGAEEYALSEAIALVRKAEQIVRRCVA